MEKREIRITAVNVGSLALFEGLLAATIGFLLSLAAWLGLAWHYTATTDSLLRGLLWGFSPGILALIVDTVIYFVAGWIIGLVNGALFNLVTNWMAGIEVGTEEVSEQPSRGFAASAPRRTEPTFGEVVDHRRRDL